MAITEYVSTKINHIEDMKRWRVFSPPGHRAIYYLGNLAEDRTDTRNRPDLRKSLDALADMASDLWYLGEVRLFQRRSSNGFEYIIEKMKPPFRPRKGPKEEGHVVRHIGNTPPKHHASILSPKIDRPQPLLKGEVLGKVLSLHDFRNLNAKLVEKMVEPVPNMSTPTEKDFTGCASEGIEADGDDEAVHLNVYGGSPHGNALQLNSAMHGFIPHDNAKPTPIEDRTFVTDNLAFEDVEDFLCDDILNDIVHAG